MFPPRWFLPYDSMFQLITALVALAVALYALQGHRWVKERTLFTLFLAFLMLSVGLFINGLSLAYTSAMGISFTTSSDLLSIADVGFWAYYIVSMIAYSLLIYAYTSRLREASIALAGGAAGSGPNGAGGGGGLWGSGGSSILAVGPLMELIMVILLLVIVVAQLANLVVKRNRYSIMVTMSFLLLLISHILIMFSSLEDVIYVAGRTVELAGFVTLFLVLYGLRRSG